MEIDEPSSMKRKFFVGTEQLSYRRDNLEINYPLEDGLGKFILFFFIFDFFIFYLFCF